MLIPKADGGARPVAIANTIVRLAKAYALHLGGKVFMRIFKEVKLQHGVAPAGPERIVHTVKAAFSVDKENTAVLVYDISNAYNERSRAKIDAKHPILPRPELRHLWRCADLIYASGPTQLVLFLRLHLRARTSTCGTEGYKRLSWGRQGQHRPSDTSTFTTRILRKRSF